MESVDQLAARLKEKYPMLRCFTDRPFGIEIEFYGLNYLITPPDGGMIKSYKVSSTALDGRPFSEVFSGYGISIGADRDSWHLEEDTSIRHRGAAELISPILRGFSGLVDAYHVFQGLCQIKGLSIDKSCGFHVHHGVDRQQFTCEHLQRMLRTVACMEDYIYLLIPGDRQNNDTCRPVEVDLKAFMVGCSEDCRTNGCHLQKAWYSPENRHDPDNCPSPRYDKTRYHGLNLHSYWYRSTIEFRYHSAILHQYDEAMQWIIFTQALVELSQGNVRTLRLHANANKWMRALYNVYCALGYMHHIKG